MLEVKKLKKSFGDKEVLKGISIKINRGELVGIIGPSGCGKSTFLRCLNLLEVPTSGKIILDGDDLTDNNSNTVGKWESATQINYTNPSSDTSNVCIYRLEIKTNNDDIDANKVYYKVVTFFKFDLPIIGNITTFKIAGDTKLLYE